MDELRRGEELLGEILREITSLQMVKFFLESDASEMEPLDQWMFPELNYRIRPIAVAEAKRVHDQIAGCLVHDITEKLEEATGQYNRLLKRAVLDRAKGWFPSKEDA